MTQLKKSSTNLLSRREKEILSHIASGLSSKEIAGILYLSKNTIDTHRRNMIRKSNARNCTELALSIK